MDENSLEKVAHLLSQSRLGIGLIPRPPDNLIPHSESAGYAVQAEVNRILRMANYGSIVGHKIGCTTSVMQKFLGIDHPCAGEIFASTVYSSGVDLPLSKFNRIGVECEIAVRVGRDMLGLKGPYTSESVGSSVKAVMAGIELVDDRYEDYKQLNAATLIGDNFFNAGAVLGEESENWQDLDLRSIIGILKINGRELAKGYGMDILGDPFEALAWIANHRAKLGVPLLAGSFVMLGSVVQTVFLDNPCEICTEFDDLSPVRVTFS